MAPQAGWEKWIPDSRYAASGMTTDDVYAVGGCAIEQRFGGMQPGEAGHVRDGA